jgi:hypothetical protein
LCRILNSYCNTEIPHLSTDDEREKSNLPENCNQLILFDNTIKKLKRDVLYYYCLVGRNLIILKNSVKKDNFLKGELLEKHLDECIRQIFKLAKDDEDLHGFSKSNRNFLIRLYNFSLKYPQIR